MKCPDEPKKIKCPDCDGVGRIVSERDYENPIHSKFSVCDTCEGEGEVLECPCGCGEIQPISDPVTDHIAVTGKMVPVALTGLKRKTILHDIIDKNFTDNDIICFDLQRVTGSPTQWLNDTFLKENSDAPKEVNKMNNVNKMNSVKKVMLDMPQGAIYQANRYDTDNEHVLHLWVTNEHIPEYGQQFDIRIPRNDAPKDPCPFDGKSCAVPMPREDCELCTRHPENRHYQNEPEQKNTMLEKWKCEVCGVWEGCALTQLRGSIPPNYCVRHLTYNAKWNRRE